MIDRSEKPDRAHRFSSDDVTRIQSVNYSIDRSDDDQKDLVRH